MDTLKSWMPVFVLAILALVAYQMFWKKDAATTATEKAA